MALRLRWTRQARVYALCVWRQILSAVYHPVVTARIKRLENLRISLKNVCSRLCVSNKFSHFRQILYLVRLNVYCQSILVYWWMVVPGICRWADRGVKRASGALASVSSYLSVRLGCHPLAPLPSTFEIRNKQLTQVAPGVGSLGRG